MQEIREAGFRFDTGPSLLTLPELFVELFERCGERLENHLDPVPVDPLCRYFYPDGSRFDCHRNQEETLVSLAAIAPGEEEAYRRFLSRAGELFERVEPVFLRSPLYDRSDFSRLPWRDLLRIDAFRSLSSSIDTAFRSDKLRQFFKRFATYNGSSPFRAPATLNVIPHVELTLGSYYIRGGLYRIAETFEKLALEKGVEFRYGCNVKSIEVKRGRCIGVRLDDDSILESPVVFSNCDATETLLRLIGREHLPFWRRQTARCPEPSGSGFVLLLGTDRQWPQLSHHNIFFSADYKEEFRQIFDLRIPPEDPTLYVTNTSLTDPSDAPTGGSNLFVLVNTPWVEEHHRWGSFAEEYGDRLIDTLESAGLDGLRASVRFRTSITPDDFLRLYRSNRGSIYGTSSNSRLSAFLRPANKVRGIDGLYLAGGSTHPGGGLPLVLLSAMHAVELANRYEAGA